jgi:hypothetical protein
MLLDAEKDEVLAERRRPSRICSIERVKDAAMPSGVGTGGGGLRCSGVLARPRGDVRSIAATMRSACSPASCCSAGTLPARKAAARASAAAASFQRSLPFSEKKEAKELLTRCQ